MGLSYSLCIQLVNAILMNTKNSAFDQFWTRTGFFIDPYLDKPRATLLPHERIVCCASLCFISPVCTPLMATIRSPGITPLFAAIVPGVTCEHNKIISTLLN